MTTSPNPASGAHTEQRMTALAGALYVANSVYTEALKSANPAATLDNICDALPEVMPEVLGVIKATPELIKVLTDDVADRLWAYTVVEYARVEAGDGYGYVFDLMVEALEKGGDPHSIRAAALGVPAKIRELAAEAAA
ncbi:hypothetical protein [Streptomyces galilaeus]|uniref:Uncharacterized protein n=1 Tax=Streptomyces galilaeus TaxID=33899 RepID=A0ABW9IWT6_STRGJ